MTGGSDDRVFFVWVDGLNGPSPQLWYGDRTEAMRPVKTLFKKQLTAAEDAGATFESLQLKYPPPKPPPAEPKIILQPSSGETS